jgi:hypothetical protein
MECFESNTNLIALVIYESNFNGMMLMTTPKVLIAVWLKFNLNSVKNGELRQHDNPSVVIEDFRGCKGNFRLFLSTVQTNIVRDTLSLDIVKL